MHPDLSSQTNQVILLVLAYQFRGKRKKNNKSLITGPEVTISSNLSFTTTEGLTRPLTVKAKVLSVRLGADQLEPSLDEVAHRPRVLVEVAWSEALVRAIKEREQLAFLQRNNIFIILNVFSAVVESRCRHWMELFAGVEREEPWIGV